MKQLELLFGLYFRPRRTMSRLLDEGSAIFGLLVVLVLCFAFEAGPIVDATGLDSGRASAFHADGEGEGDGSRNPFAIVGRIVSSGPIASVAGLSLLYAPSLLLAATFLAPIGSFGVAFRRDFGLLVTCVFFVWAAAHLPFALGALVTPFGPLLRVGGTLAFAALLVPAVELALGVALAEAAGAVLLGFLGYLLTPVLHILASPFLLLFAWFFLSGNLADVEWGLKARRSHKRLLEAATLNPRDADAHIQLGHMHLRRRQRAEARARFEKAAEIDPADPDARFQLGRLDRADGRHASAIQHFQAVIDKDPAFSRHEIWREIGLNYLDARAYEDARKALEHFAAQRAHDPEGLVLLGEALAALGRTEEARARFREAVEAADTTPRYRAHEVAPWRRRAAKHL